MMQATVIRAIANSRNDYQNDGIANAIADTIEKGRPRLVAESECLKTPHQDAVRDYKTNEYR